MHCNTPYNDMDHQMGDLQTFFESDRYQYRKPLKIDEPQGSTFYCLKIDEHVVQFHDNCIYVWGQKVEKEMIRKIAKEMGII